MSRADAASEVLDLALGLGFDLAGIAPLRRPAGAERFEAWLAAGHQAGMAWLEEHRERILEPARSLPGGRSLLVVGLGHSRPAVALADGTRVARYAAGRDYHNEIGRRLRKLARRLRERGLLGEWKKVVDAGPLLERSHAAEAGIGFHSKAANLLHPRFGPWFFLGELLMDAELEPGPAAPGPPTGSCGTCTACLDACPTAAIVAPGVVDARRCISYHTIESREPVPHALRPAVAEWLFGCDVCSEVCPWGHDAPDLGARLGLHPALAESRAEDWLAAPDEGFGARLEGSPLKRAGRDGLARNAALALAARPSDAGRDALLAALADRTPLVREAAFWALARAHGDEARVRAALARAEAAEADSAARAGMLCTRDARG